MKKIDSQNGELMSKPNVQPSNTIASEVLPARLSKLKSDADNFQSINLELKQLNQSPDEYWYAMGSRLHKILRHRYYREGGYRSFSEYCARGLGYSRQHVYKLMKVVQFIDARCRKDASPAERELTEKLMTLGFTKLYLLHSLPIETLNRLLNDGIQDNHGLPISLSHASIGQLKRALAQPAAPRVQSVPAKTLLKTLKSQAWALNQLAQECRQQAESEAFCERLDTIAHYAQSVLNCAEALGEERK